jgi:hypothetical protein
MALARPHILLISDSLQPVAIARGTVHDRSIIVVGGNATVGGIVHGDVVVAGGNLFLHPGAQVDGEAIAIGGGVYRSTRAVARGGTRAFRDETYLSRRSNHAMVLMRRELSVDLRPAWELPVRAGVRIPSYDRINGLSAPWAPLFRPTRGIEIEPRVTYRSQLGTIDPLLAVSATLPKATGLTLAAGRVTATNDAWIRTDLSNSLSVIAGGSDVRNYYRADRVELLVQRSWATATVAYSFGVGGATERSWSVGDPDSLRSTPWSFFDREDVDAMTRGNPSVERGRISSALAVATLAWRLGDVHVRAELRGESGWDAPETGSFTQGTGNVGIAFPTFGAQRFSAEMHAVATGSTAPRQRYAYLGGGSTLPTIEPPLAMGGGSLFFLDSRYDIPVSRIKIPFAGSPTVTLRYATGAAGPSSLPTFTQNIGTRVALGFVRIDWWLDPVSRRHEFGIGWSFVR